MAVLCKGPPLPRRARPGNGRPRRIHEEDEDGESTEPAFPLQGRRILVLSLQGDILQVVTHPTEPMATFQSICCFGRKLLATYRYWTEESAGTPRRKHGMLALQGL